jgi:hypothetical protein
MLRETGTEFVGIGYRYTPDPCVSKHSDTEIASNLSSLLVFLLSVSQVKTLPILYCRREGGGAIIATAKNGLLYLFLILEYMRCCRSGSGIRDVAPS